MKGDRRAYPVKAVTVPKPKGTYIEWADVNEIDFAPQLGSLEGAEDVEGRDFVPLSQVMPAGKTKRDMCPLCFQIPAGNGVCGC